MTSEYKPSKLSAWLQNEQVGRIKYIKKRTGGYKNQQAFQESQDRENVELALRFGIQPDSAVAEASPEWQLFLAGKSEWLPQGVVKSILDNFAPRPKDLE
jgi:hypothetical protein